MAVIGVDIGGTKVAAVRWSPSGPTDELHWRVHSLAGRAAEAAVLDTIEAAVAAAAAGEPVEAVGLSVAGWLDAGRHRVLLAANLGLDQVELRARLEQRLGVAVVLDNDGNATAWAEARHGYGRKAGCLVVLALGTGVGGGVVLNGEVVTGGHGLAGELGHVPVTGTGVQCVCGGRDCLELYASGPALARMAGQPDAPAALAAAAAGNRQAVAALDTTVTAVTQAVRLLVPILDPDRVVLAGSVAAAIGERLPHAVAAGLGERPLAMVLPAPDVQLSRLGPSAAAIGAAELAAQHRRDLQPTPQAGLDEGKVHV